MRSSRSRALRPALAGIGLLTLAALPLRAEDGGTVVDYREQVPATRPEAWAMRLFAAATQSTGVSAPVERRLGALDLGIEAASIPHLSARQRTVGFHGTKTEDLNRAPAIGRPHAALGIGAGFSLVADWVPPLEMDHVKANIVTVALERPLVNTETWSLGARVGAGSGRIEGDITCPRSAVAAGDDPIGNPYDCHAASNDRQSYHWRTAGLTLGRTLTPTLAAHLSASVWRLDGLFRVDADYGSVEDYSRLAYVGNDWGGALGLDWSPRPLWRLGAEVFYAPLDVVRSATDGGRKQHDDLWNLRLLASYRVR